MDSLGVDRHLVSPSPGFYHYDLDAAMTIATPRDCNHEIRDMITSWPDRFAGLATLPMQDVPAAIAEKEAILWTNLERLLGL
jgi:aminocarboxymuconate-semialdehyde decarboxylase